MSEYTDGNTRTFQATGALARYLMVKLTAGKLVVQTATGDTWLGVVSRAVLAADDRVAVILKNKSGTMPCVADAAITVGLEVETAAGGKVSPYTSGVKVGVALTAAAADDDEIEVLVY